MLGPMEALSLAIKRVGGVSKLAAKLGVAPNVVSNWRKRRRVPADQCLAIERVAGISAHALRPDVFGEAA